MKDLRLDRLEKTLSKALRHGVLPGEPNDPLSLFCRAMASLCTVSGLSYEKLSMALLSGAALLGKHNAKWTADDWEAATQTAWREPNEN